MNEYLLALLALHNPLLAIHYCPKKQTDQGWVYARHVVWPWPRAAA